MDCREARSRFSRRLDGSLTPEEAADVQNHLSACTDCSGEWAALEQGDLLLASFSYDDPPGEALSGLRARIQTAIDLEGEPEVLSGAPPSLALPSGSRRSATGRMLLGAGLTAAAVLALFILVGPFQKPVSPPPADFPEPSPSTVFPPTLEAKVSLAEGGTPEDRMDVLLDTANGQVLRIAELSETRHADPTEEVRSYCRLVEGGIFSALALEGTGEARSAWEETSAVHADVFRETLPSLKGEARSAVEEAIRLCTQ